MYLSVQIPLLAVGLEALGDIQWGGWLTELAFSAPGFSPVSSVAHAMLGSLGSRLDASVAADVLRLDFRMEFEKADLMLEKLGGAFGLHELMGSSKELSCQRVAVTREVPETVPSPPDSEAILGAGQVSVPVDRVKKLVAPDGCVAIQSKEALGENRVRMEREMQEQPHNVQKAMRNIMRDAQPSQLTPPPSPELLPRPVRHC
jgi:hypothetical protein